MSAYSNKCCSFLTSASQYVDFGNVFDFERTDTFSWSYWLKATPGAAIQYLISKQQAGTPGGWAIYTDTGTLGPTYFALTNTASTNCLVAYTTRNYLSTRDNGWHHVVITYAGTSTYAGIKFYVDSCLFSTIGITSNLTATIKNSATMRFGAIQSGFPTGCYTGLLDDVAVYNRVLTASEVLAIYDLGGPGDLSTLSTWGVCTGWWKMGDGDTYPTILDNTVGGNNGTMTSMSAANLVSPAQIGSSPSRGPNASKYFKGRKSNVIILGSDVDVIIMEAKDSVTGVVYTWPVSIPDMIGEFYPGPNVPVKIAIRAVRDSYGKIIS